MRLSLLTSWLLLGAAPAAAQSVAAGIEAWNAGRTAEAVTIWRPLAAMGSAEAAFNLGQAYKFGRGVPADPVAAKRWYEQAAKAGNVQAQTTLGLTLYQEGNRPAALRWLQLAADAGDPRAMLVYGTALFNGDGVAEDRVRGYALVSRAAASGLTQAKGTLNEMDVLIPPTERIRALALAEQLGKARPVKPAPAPPAPVTTAAIPAGAQGVTTVFIETTITEPCPDPRRLVRPAIARRPVSGSLAAPVAAGGAYRIQLGAFRDESAAQRLYGELAPRLGNAVASLVPAGTLTRLQVGPFPTRAAASAACAALAPRPCFPVR
jgi:cell division septation protein DedD